MAEDQGVPAEEPTERGSRPSEPPATVRDVGLDSREACVFAENATPLVVGVQSKLARRKLPPTPALLVYCVDAGVVDAACVVDVAEVLLDVVGAKAAISPVDERKGEGASSGVTLCFKAWGRDPTGARAWATGAGDCSGCTSSRVGGAARAPELAENLPLLPTLPVPEPVDMPSWSVGTLEPPAFNAEASLLELCGLLPRPGWPAESCWSLRRPPPSTSEIGPGTWAERDEERRILLEAEAPPPPLPIDSLRAEPPNPARPDMRSNMFTSWCTGFAPSWTTLDAWSALARRPAAAVRGAVGGLDAVCHEAT